MAQVVSTDSDKRKETAMPIIKDAFEYGLRKKVKSFYLRLFLSGEDLQILTTLTERQKDKFKKKKLIPYPLLQFFWDLGFLPIIKRPTEGMRVSVFLDLLSDGEYKDKRHMYKGIWLRDKITEEEYPETIRSHEMYLKVPGEGRKWVPISYFRDIPGTIIR